jgi:hypothetical protein
LDQKREAKLAQALRANLRRRKAAPTEKPASSKPDADRDGLVLRHAQDEAE